MRRMELNAQSETHLTGLGMAHKAEGEPPVRGVCVGFEPVGVGHTRLESKVERRLFALADVPASDGAVATGRKELLAASPHGVARARKRVDAETVAITAALIKQYELHCKRTRRRTG